MSDITNPKLLYLKAVLFVCLGLLAAGLLLAEQPSLRSAALIAVVVWAFARAYYFVFYVIEHYIDPSFRYAGLLSLTRYVVGRSGKTSKMPRSAKPGRSTAER